MVETGFQHKRVGGFTVREILMVGIPALSYLVAGLLAWGDVKTEFRLLQQAQESMERERASHEASPGHRGTQNDLGQIRTEQAVQRETLKNIDEKIDDYGEVLQDINRKLNTGDNR